MLSHIRMRLFHSVETIVNKGFPFFCKEIVFINRTCILLEKGLKGFVPPRVNRNHSDLVLIEINSDNVDRYFFQSRTRRLKAIGYVKKGYHGYGIVRDKKIIGDIWCFMQNSSPKIHPDLKWLDIKCAPNECYSFDMYLSLEERGGGNLAAFLENALFYDLQRKGYERIYGYVWADNFPALWAHRVVKWKEKKKFVVNRFLNFKKKANKSE